LQRTTKGEGNDFYRNDLCALLPRLPPPPPLKLTPTALALERYDAWCDVDALVRMMLEMLIGTKRMHALTGYRLSIRARWHTWRQEALSENFAGDEGGPALPEPPTEAASSASQLSALLRGGEVVGFPARAHQRLVATLRAEKAAARREALLVCDLLARSIAAGAQSAPDAAAFARECETLLALFDDARALLPAVSAATKSDVRTFYFGDPAVYEARAADAVRDHRLERQRERPAPPPKKTAPQQPPLPQQPPPLPQQPPPPLSRPPAERFEADPADDERDAEKEAEAAKTVADQLATIEADTKALKAEAEALDAAWFALPSGNARSLTCDEWLSALGEKKAPERAAARRVYDVLHERDAENQVVLVRMISFLFLRSAPPAASFSLVSPRSSSASRSTTPRRGSSTGARPRPSRRLARPSSPPSSTLAPSSASTNRTTAGPWSSSVAASSSSTAAPCA